MFSYFLQITNVTLQCAPSDHFKCVTPHSEPCSCGTHLIQFVKSDWLNLQTPVTGSQEYIVFIEKSPLKENCSNSHVAAE